MWWFVSTRPTSPAQSCVVGNGTGTVGSSNVSNVTITCTTNVYGISGTISGLTASGLVLANGADSLTVAGGASTFVFSTKVADGTPYAVHGLEPTGQRNVFSRKRRGDRGGRDCHQRDGLVYRNDGGLHRRGHNSRLTSEGLVLLNGGDMAYAAASATVFRFSTLLASGASYSADRPKRNLRRPCTVANASGTIGSANVANVAVTCKTTAYTIGGTISGLTSNGLVLANGGATVAPAKGATQYRFATAVPSGTAYAVTVKTQPAGLPCRGSQAVQAPLLKATSLTPMCRVSRVAIRFAGAFSGLTGSGLVLQDNGADNLTVSASAMTFTFVTLINKGAKYAVTVKTQAAGQICTVTSGSGVMSSAAIRNSCG